MVMWEVTYQLWDNDSGNIICEVNSLTGLAQVAFQLGQVNPNMDSKDIVVIEIDDDYPALG